MAFRKRHKKTPLSDLFFNKAADLNYVKFLKEQRNHNGKLVLSPPQ